MMGVQAAIFTPRQQNPTHSWEFNSSERRCWASGGEENRRGGSRRLHSTRRPGCEGNHQADGHAGHHQDAHDPEYALAKGNRCSFAAHVTHRRMRVTIGRLKSSSLGTSCRASPRGLGPRGIGLALTPPPTPSPLPLRRERGGGGGAAAGGGVRSAKADHWPQAQKGDFQSPPEYNPNYIPFRKVDNHAP
jgi:hypothetical protein